MEYYEILVGDLRYHGSDALTYSSEAPLTIGSVVQIELRNKKTLGLVYKKVAKPSFEAKPVSATASFPPLPAEQLELIAWLRRYYPAHFGAIVRQFLPPAVPFPKKLPIKTATAPDTSGLPPLTKTQQAAFAQLQSSGYHLLRGITGSGKTRLYIEATIRAVSAGRSAVILTPEIGLTAQLSTSFRDVFGDAVHVLHSRQTAAERRNEWYQILKATQPLVIIGPRSALFAPVHNIGLIAIDESHDQAYKNESAPHYRTERVAAKLGALHDACVMSGSATPNIEDYYLTEAKQRPIITMDVLAKQSPDEPATKRTIIDMRDNANTSRSKILSTPLITAVQAALQKGEQSLLFLNRRGTAAAILCNACGWRALCSHCDLPLTYHDDTHSLRCHTCGRISRPPTTCPECNNTDIVLRSIGTKAVAAEVARLFPEARVQRFDSDTHKDEQLESQLKGLKKGSVDIIIGTQMITKGLDLPLLSVVGILNADGSLLIPDFTASERTYQLISQAVGRVGRGHRDTSTVIVQSYSPEQTVLTAALHAKWAEYYQSELAERRTFHFPPFVYILKLTCARASSDKAEEAALELKSSLARVGGIAIDGPSPSFHPRENKKYKWQIIVKTKQREKLLDIITNLPAGWSYDIDPINLL